MESLKRKTGVGTRLCMGRWLDGWLLAIGLVGCFISCLMETNRWMDGSCCAVLGLVRGEVDALERGEGRWGVVFLLLEMGGLWWGGCLTEGGVGCVHFLCSACC